MITSSQIRMARAELRWTVAELATAAGVGKNTVWRIEGDQEGNKSTLSAIQRALEAAGIELYDDGERIGVTVAKESRSGA